MTTYKEAGVDIAVGNEFVKKIQQLCPDIGGFSGLYPLGDDYLAASTDGVGTKLKLAFAMDKHDTIGIDLVAMNVNDILTAGAKPLFFLDYFATSKLELSKAQEIIQGIVKGCQMAECLLLGGETAEMPGFYHSGEYDLAGFTVGIVKKSKLIDGSKLKPGDCLVGIASSGFHSNGYSLVRKVLEKRQISLGQTFAEAGVSLGEVLLTPTRIYVKQIFELMQDYEIKGMSHITGGGFIDNIPRMLPKGLGICIERGTWPIPPIFSWLQAVGQIADEEMFQTFNMGIGMVLGVDPLSAEKLCAQEEDCWLIGRVQPGSGVVWA